MPNSSLTRIVASAPCRRCIWKRTSSSCEVQLQPGGALRRAPHFEGHANLFCFLSARSPGYVSLMSRDAKRLKALQMLVLANAGWGLSFPATKALAMSQQALLSTKGTWFIASLCVVYRFAIAAIILLLMSATSLARLK